VTFDAADTRALLGEERVVHAHSPTNRHLPNLLRNFGLALRLVPRLRPRVLLTTGAGVAVPFAWVARLCGARVVFVESLTRIERPSLTYRLLRPVVTRTYVQWPELQQAVPGARFHGTVFEGS
jgi:UDP-N-acetylglucosamine:LPS N-acetylglucosamine transferase